MAAVTIVVATFNRPQALRNAIRVARAQTLTDWEMFIIGDACSDDSGSVAAGFGDRRIRWINIPERFGEQAGPNSVGMALADSPLIAFLNHYDLWMPEHLESASKALETS